MSSFSVGYEQIGLQLMKSELQHSKNVFHAKKSKKNDEVDFELFALFQNRYFFNKDTLMQ